MKKFILFALLLSIGLMCFSGAGCVNQQNQTTNNTTLETAKVVYFYDPLSGFSDELVMLTKTHLPDAQVETRCVDYQKIIYGQASESEAVCIQKDSQNVYQNNTALLISFLEGGANTVMFVHDNGQYAPVNYTLQPLALANRICAVHKFSDCAALKKPQPIKATMYLLKDSDAAGFSQLVTVLKNNDVELTVTNKIADQSDISMIKSNTKTKFIPVLMTDQADADSAFILNLLLKSLGGSDMSGEKIGNKYAFYPTTMGSEYYIGNASMIKAVVYVPDASKDTYKGIFDAYSTKGVMFDITYETANPSVIAETGEKFLPLLVVDMDSISEPQKKQLDSLVDVAVSNSGIERVMKKYSGGYVADTSYATPELYAGGKVSNVTFDLYIMSQCPYGTQMQKAVIPVVELLGAKLDVNNKFVYYTMHGDAEVNDNLAQYCVGKTYPAKEWDFIRCYIEKSGNTSTCMKSLGIDEAKISSCAQSAKTAFSIAGTSFPIYAEENKLYDVSGSPTLVFMGKQFSISRNPETIKQFVCSILDKPPAACNKTLSYTILPGFGPINATGTATATSSGSCG